MTLLLGKISPVDSTCFFHQIASREHRVRLIAIIQTCSSLGFIFKFTKERPFSCNMENILPVKAECAFLKEQLYTMFARSIFTIEASKC